MENQFIVLCPKCGREIKVPLAAAGETGECPYCGHEFAIPGPDAPAASAPDDDAHRFENEVLWTRAEKGLGKYRRLFGLSPWSVKVACVWIALTIMFDALGRVAYGKAPVGASTCIMVAVLGGTLECKRWARVAMVALLLLSIGLAVSAPFGVASAPGERSQDFWIDVFVRAVSAFATLVVPLVLMFLPPTNRWFAIGKPLPPKTSRRRNVV